MLQYPHRNCTGNSLKGVEGLTTQAAADVLRGIVDRNSLKGVEGTVEAALRDRD